MYNPVPGAHAPTDSKTDKVHTLSVEWWVGVGLQLID